MARRGYAETGQALDAICTRAEAEAKPLTGAATGDAKHDAPLIAKLVGVNDKYIPQVKAVTPDSKLKSAYDQFVATLGQIATNDKSALAAANKGDTAAYVAAIKSQNAVSKTNKQAAKALGAPACAKN